MKICSEEKNINFRGFIVIGKYYSEKVLPGPHTMHFTFLDLFIYPAFRRIIIYYLSNPEMANL